MYSHNSCNMVRNESVAKPGDLVVIGVGLPRTGTKSLKVALERLLGGHCYHIQSLLKAKDNSHKEFWKRVQEKQVNGRDWKNFFRATNSITCCGFPTAFFYKELMKTYPGAKFILTTRNPSSWYESVKDFVMVASTYRLNVIARVYHKLFGDGTYLDDILNFVCFGYPDGFNTGLFGAVNRGEESAIEFYEQWTTQVRNTIPEEKLLIFEASQGWGPLCRFLSMPIPDGPYPWINEDEITSSDNNNGSNANDADDATTTTKSILLSVVSKTTALVTVASVVVAVIYFRRPSIKNWMNVV